MALYSLVFGSVFASTLLAVDVTGPALIGAEPLSLPNVLKQVKGVRQWKRMALELLVPRRKVDDIDRQYPTLEQKKEAALEYWLTVDPSPSWRRLVMALDWGIRDQNADHCVGPITDPTFTLHNVKVALTTVTNWGRKDGLGDCLGVPNDKQAEFHEHYSTDEEQKEAVLQYWLLYSPYASWDVLAGHLYHMEENVALEAVLGYVDRPTEPTLTLTNLHPILKLVNSKKWREFGAFLDVPVSKLDEIEHKCSNSDECIERMAEEWLSSHPAPSWRLVAEALYQRGFYPDEPNLHKALSTVMTTYIGHSSVKYYFRSEDHEQPQKRFLESCQPVGPPRIPVSWQLKESHDSANFIVQGPVRVIDTPECPNPNRITMDKQSHLVVSSWMSKVCVYRKDGTMLFTFGGEGKENRKFSNANGVAVDDNGFIYVADWGNNRIQVFSPDGGFFTSVGSSGTDSLGDFNYITGIQFNNDGELFVCDFRNSRVQVIDESFKTYFGVQVADKSSGTFLFKYSFGTEGDGKLSQPEGIAFDSNGHVYITDGKKDCVFVYNTDGTFIRHFGSTGDERGQLKKPTGIDIDRNNFVYVAERLNNRVSVFRTSGEFVTSFGSYGDDTPLDFVEPLGLTVDEDGFIYICDSLNDRIQVF